MSTDPSAKPGARPGKPATAAIGKPATGAISKKAEPGPGIVEEGAKPPPLAGASGPVSFEFEESAEPQPKKSHAPPPAPLALADAAAPAAGAAPASARGRAAPPAPSEEDVDPDVKPGSRKDLWTCPHCGAGNKPGRPTCRTCNKSPDEPVVVPWFKQPLPLAGLVGGVVLVVVLLVLLLGRVDLSLKPADAAHLDKAIRHGQHGSSHTLDAGTFEGVHRFAVCGRCIGTNANTGVAGALDCVLSLGADAADESGGASATFPAGSAPQVAGANSYVVLHLVPNGSVKLSLAKGGIVSLTGDEGHIDGITNGDGEYTVLVDGLLP